LIATLLCLGLLTKFNEITAMKACGISIYRTVTPIVILSIAISFFSFYLQENILPYTNQQAERIWDKIRDVPARTYNAFDRRWVMSKNGKRIYHYNYFDPLISSFNPLSIYDIDSDSWSIKRRFFASRGFLTDSSFSMTAGWTRDFENGRPVGYKADNQFSVRTSEKMNYFIRERKEPDQMSFSELKTHIAELKDRNFETRDFEVDLVYKTSFPMACLVMALMGIPFAFSMGKRGTLVGLGLSLAIAMVYWGTIGIFKNLGHVGYLAPLLAAWGPNLIFGLAGLYLIFSLRT
jgi:LPS export ABC transporter permease LptG